MICISELLLLLLFFFEKVFLSSDYLPPLAEGTAWSWYFRINWKLIWSHFWPPKRKQ